MIKRAMMWVKMQRSKFDHHKTNTPIPVETTTENIFEHHIHHHHHHEQQHEQPMYSNTQDMFTAATPPPPSSRRLDDGKGRRTISASQPPRSTRPPNIGHDIEQLDYLLEDLLREVHSPVNQADHHHHQYPTNGYISDGLLSRRGPRPKAPIKLYRLDLPLTQPMQRLLHPLTSGSRNDVMDNVYWNTSLPVGGAAGYETDSCCMKNRRRLMMMADERCQRDGYETEDLSTRRRYSRTMPPPPPRRRIPVLPSTIMETIPETNIDSSTNRRVVPVLMEEEEEPSRPSNQTQIGSAESIPIQVDFASSSRLPTTKSRIVNAVYASPPITSSARVQKTDTSLQNRDEKLVNREIDLGQNQTSSNVVSYHPSYVKNNLRFWYKPKISREETIRILKNKTPGHFLIRDSVGFPGAYGLALKVAHPPIHVQIKPGADPTNELVRHYLIEPTSQGVRLKGCANEPTYATLSALVYHHTIDQIALPCKLILPSNDPLPMPATAAHAQTSAHSILEKGAACYVVFLGTIDLASSSSTNNQALANTCQRAIDQLMNSKTRPVLVHFRVSSQGITVTDVARQSFTSRHFAVNTVLHCGQDSDRNRMWNADERVRAELTEVAITAGPLSPTINLPPPSTMTCKPRCFAFITRSQSGNLDSVFVFAEFDPKQPASAIVNFVTKVMLAGVQQQQQRSDTLSANV
ncbi:hypothetical protein ACOME3_005940 [Neoechinorhynchus agilis]